MTIFSRRPDDDMDAKALNDYLDDLASGVLAPRNEIEPDIATVVSQLKDVGHRTAEPPGLRTQLWEDLMNTATSVEASPLGPPVSRDFRPAQDPPARLRELPRRIITRPKYALELLAAAIILLGLVGASLIGRGDGGSDPTPESAALAPLLATSPEASPAVPCGETTDQPYSDCPYTLDSIGSNFIKPADVLTDSEQQVEIQGWAITAGNTYTGVEDDTAAQGAVTDFVLSGAYSATFTVPVVVNHGGYTDRFYEYLDAGETVELVRGDSVSYQLGGLVEIHNPLSVQRLEFKRAVIYDGDISAYSATSEGITTRSEGKTALLPPENPSDAELNIELYYLFKPNGTMLLPPQWDGLTVIGPVDPQSAPEGIDGFVLVIGAFRG